MRHLAVVLLVGMTSAAAAATSPARETTTAGTQRAARPVVADGVGVPEALAGGFSEWFGPTVIHQAPLLQAVPTADGGITLLGYDGFAPVLRGGDLQAVTRPADPRVQGEAAAADVTGDDVPDLLVGTEDGVSVVDGTSGAVLADHDLGLPRAGQVAAGRVGDGVYVAALPGIEGQDGRFVDTMAFLWRLDGPAEVVEVGRLRLPGGAVLADIGPGGLLVHSGTAVAGRLQSHFSLVGPDGVLRWQRQSRSGQYALAQGWVPGAEDRVWFLEGNDYLVEAWSVDGSTRWEVSLPSLSQVVGAVFASAAAGDVTGDGVVDYFLATAGLGYWNAAESHLHLVDGDGRSVRPVGRLPGMPQHLVVADATGNGAPDMVAATLAAGEGRIGPLAATTSSVALWEGPLATPRWVAAFPGGGLTGWSHRPHRGVAVADVGPDGQRAVAVLRTWAGALDALDPLTGEVLTRVEQPGAVSDAERGPCGILAAHLTGHLTLPDAQVLLDTVPTEVVSLEDCGAVAATFHGLRRIAPDGEMVWQHHTDTAVATLDVVGDVAVAGLNDGRLVAVDVRSGLPAWHSSAATPGPTTRLRTSALGHELAVAACERFGLVPAQLFFTTDVVRLLDPADGAVRWEAHQDGCPYELTAFDGAVAFLTPGVGHGTVNVLDADGTPRWRLDVPGLLWDLRVVGTDLVVTVQRDDGWHLVRIDVSGAPTAEVGVADRPVGIGPWSGEDLAYVRLDGRMTMVVHAWDGTELGSIAGLGKYGPPGHFIAGGSPDQVNSEADPLGRCVPDTSGFLCWGRPGQASLAVLVPDGGAPHVEVSSRLPDTVATGASIVVEGTAGDDVAIAHGLLVATSAQGAPSHGRLAFDGDVWTGSTGPLPAGPHTVRVTVVDSAGHATTRQLGSVVVDGSG